MQDQELYRLVRKLAEKGNAVWNQTSEIDTDGKREQELICASCQLNAYINVRTKDAARIVD